MSLFNNSLNLFLFKKFFWSRYGNRYFSIIGLFAILGFILGICALIVVMSIMDGFQHQIKANLMNISPNYILPLTRVPDQSLSDYLDALVQSNPEHSWFVHIPAKGFLHHTLHGENVVEIERVNRDYFEYLRPFISPPLDAPAVVLGEEAARRLWVSPGDWIELTIPGLYEDPLRVIPRTVRANVAATIKTGIYHVDEYKIFVPEETVPAHVFPSNWPFEIYLFGQYSPFELAGLRSFEAVQSVQSWQDRNKTLYYALWLERTIMHVFLWLIILVALSSIISLLTVFFADRKQTLGVMMCLGLSHGQLHRLLTMFGFAIGATGSAIGILLAAACLWIIDYTEYFKLPSIYYHRQLPIHLNIPFLAAVVALSLCACYIVSAVISQKLLRRRLLSHLSDDPVT